MMHDKVTLVLVLSRSKINENLRITQQSSPERDESNAFSKNVFLASTEDNNLGTEPKFELI
jgi:hypothetical protein